MEEPKETSRILTFMAKTEEILKDLTETLKAVPTKEGMELSVEKGVQRAIESCKRDLVSKEEFNPIQKMYDKLTNFSFGLIALIGGIIVAIIYIAKEIVKK
jgi:hypothetical protein